MLYGPALVPASEVSMYDEPACGGTRLAVVDNPILTSCHCGFMVAQLDPKIMAWTILAYAGAQSGTFRCRDRRSDGRHPLDRRGFGRWYRLPRCRRRTLIFGRVSERSTGYNRAHHTNIGAAPSRGM